MIIRVSVGFAPVLMVSQRLHLYLLWSRFFIRQLFERVEVIVRLFHPSVFLINEAFCLQIQVDTDSHAPNEHESQDRASAFDSELEQLLHFWSILRVRVAFLAFCQVAVREDFWFQGLDATEANEAQGAGDEDLTKHEHEASRLVGDRLHFLLRVKRVHMELHIGPSAHRHPSEDVSEES